MPAPSAIESVFRASERRLWSLCYRITGVAADADDVVQEAFARAVEVGSPLKGGDLERWLVRVATNLSLERRLVATRHLGASTAPADADASWPP